MTRGRAVPLTRRLVAHRGKVEGFPENSLEGVRAAISAGAAWIEIDVQLTADRFPMVVHDSDLERVTGKRLDVRDLNTTEAGRLSLIGAEQPACIPRLEDVVDAVRDSKAGLFVELKRESLRRFGCHASLRPVLSAIRPLGVRACLISFDRATVDLARRQGAVRTGWVLDRYDDVRRQYAQKITPDFLFCRRQRIPLWVRNLWAGTWQWVIYVVDSPVAARHWFQRGADLVETDRVESMLHRLGRGDR